MAKKKIGRKQPRSECNALMGFMVLQGGNLKKNGFFHIFPNLIKINKFQEQLIILEGDYDGHFFAQGYFGSQSLHRKKIFQFFVPKRSGV